MPDERILQAVLKFTLDRSSVEQARRGIVSLEDALVDVEKQAKETESEVDKLRFEQAAQAIRNAQRFERALEAINKEAMAVEDRMDRIRNFAGYFGDLGSTMLVAGAAITAPIALAANTFVQGAGRADAVSRQWLDTTDELARSQMRIGRVAAEAVLPVIEKAAGLAEKVADFVEQNPQALKIAAGVGAGLLVGGTLFEALEKGIRLYTDAKSLAATGQQVLAGGLMQKAADKQLAAAGLMLKGGGGGLLKGVGGAAAAGGGGAAAGAGGTAAAAAGGGLTAAGIGIAGGLGLLLGGGIYQAIASSDIGKNAGLANLQQYASVGAYYAGETAEFFGAAQGTAERWFANVGNALGVVSDEAKATANSLGGMAQATEEAGNKAQQTGSALRNSPALGAAVDAYIAYQQETQRAEAQYQKQRLSMVEQFEEQRTQAEETYQENRTQFTQDFLDQQAEALDNFRRSQERAARDFERSETRTLNSYNEQKTKLLQQIADDETKTETAYYTQRANLAAQFGQDTERMEADHRARMRRLAEDHQGRLEDAIRGQDAIAFLREQQSYEVTRRREEQDYLTQADRKNEDFTRQMADLEASFAEQRAVRQADNQTRLTEMEQQFEKERQQRTDDFDLRQTDAQNEFDLQRQKEQTNHDEQLAKMDQQHGEEMSKADQQQQEALRDLDQQHQEEQAARDRAFGDTLRELDDQLLGERELRNEYYVKMTADLEAWLQSMRGKVQSDLPGYSPAGTAGSGGTPRLGRRATGGYANDGIYRLGEGGKEFVLDNQTTRMAEAAMGSPLSQSNFTSMFRGGNNIQISMPINIPPGNYNTTQMVDLIDQKVNRSLERLFNRQ